MKLLTYHDVITGKTIALLNEESMRIYACCSGSSHFYSSVLRKDKRILSLSLLVPCGSDSPYCLLLRRWLRAPARSRPTLVCADASVATATLKTLAVLPVGWLFAIVAAAMASSACATRLVISVVPMSRAVFSTRMRRGALIVCGGAFSEKAMGL